VLRDDVSALLRALRNLKVKRCVSCIYRYVCGGCEARLACNIY